MSRISQYIIDTLPTVSDYIVGTEYETLQTKNYKISNIIDLQSVKPTGSFYQDANQVGGFASPNAVIFSKTNLDATNQWAVTGSPATRLTPAVSGLYNFDFTFFATTANAGNTISFWLKKNGTTNISNSTVSRYLDTIVNTYVINANYSISLSVGDYLEVLFQSDFGTPTLIYSSSVLSGGPALPSASVIINKI